MRMSFYIFLIGLAAGCGKKSDDDSDSPSLLEKTGLALSEASPAQSMEISSQTIATFDKAVEQSAGSLILELQSQGTTSLTEQQETIYGSEWCTTNGEPMAEKGKKGEKWVGSSATNVNSDGTIQRLHPNYAARFFHCKMKIDSGNPETVRGSYSMVKGFLCKLNKDDTVDFKNGGSFPVEFTVDDKDDCFDPDVYETGDMWGVKIKLTAVITILDDEDNWDKEVKFTKISFNGESAGEGSYKFQFSNNEKYMAIRQIDSFSEGESSAWSFRLTTDGLLSYEFMSFKIESESNLVEDNSLSTQHMRMAIQGNVNVEIDENGKVDSSFDTVDTYAGAYSFLETHPDNSSVYSATLATINGSSDAGFETYTKNCNNDGAQMDCDASDISTWNDATKDNTDDGEISCFPKGKKCNDVKPIVFKKGDEAFLLIGDSVDDLEKSPTEWYNALKKPLSFSEVTTDFDQLTK